MQRHDSAVKCGAALVIFGLGAIQAHAAAPPPDEGIIALAEKCAPSVHPITLAFVVAHESGNDRYAINVNGSDKAFRPSNVSQAEKRLRELKQSGANYDVGYGQINSANFKRLGVSGTQLLDPCVNLRAAETILKDCYLRTKRDSQNAQTALRNALSCYNTGNYHYGYTNGYVASVQEIADKYVVPRLEPQENGQATTKRAIKNENTPEESKTKVQHDGEIGAFETPDSSAFDRNKRIEDEST